MASYAESLPHPALRTLVECYWASAGPAVHRVLPDGAIDIIVAGSAGAIVVGTMTTAVVVPASPLGAIGVRFRAGEAVRILRDAAALTDTGAPLSDLWGGDARAVEDALLGSTSVAGGSARSHLARATPILDRLLRARLAAHGAEVDRKVRRASAILARGGSVREAATAADLSERQLARRFHARVGVAPKLFARVLRLQRATHALRDGASLVEAAARAGYADQPHFTRDARELALVTPAELSDSFKTTRALAS